MLALLMLMDGDADQPVIQVFHMVLFGMLMHPIIVPALFRVWKVGALEAQVSNLTLFLSPIKK